MDIQWIYHCLICVSVCSAYHPLTEGFAIYISLTVSFAIIHIWETLKVEEQHWNSPLYLLY